MSDESEESAGPRRLRSLGRPPRHRPGRRAGGRVCLAHRTPPHRCPPLRRRRPLCAPGGAGAHAPGADPPVTRTAPRLQRPRLLRLPCPGEAGSNPSSKSASSTASAAAAAATRSPSATATPPWTNSSASTTRISARPCWAAKNTTPSSSPQIPPDPPPAGLPLACSRFSRLSTRLHPPRRVLYTPPGGSAGPLVYVTICFPARPRPRHPRRGRSSRPLSQRSATPEISVRTLRRNCTHYWQLNRPDSQYSRGICAKCGMTKRFLNYGEELRLPYGRRRNF